MIAIPVLVVLLTVDISKSSSILNGFYSPMNFFYGVDYEGLVAINSNLDNDLVKGRYLLKHHNRDGGREILRAYGMSEERIDSLRNSTIITSFAIDEDGEIIVTTADGDQEEAISFIPGNEYNITNPITIEQTSFKALVMGPRTIQTIAEGNESNTIEIKTWTFSPMGINLNTEVAKKNQLYPTVADQVFVRVDEEDNPKPLRLGWVL